MFYSLPPAGQLIHLSAASSSSDHFTNISTLQFYSSGTQALSAAIIACIKLRPDLESPEVLVPAYSCPDLISAVLYAGAKPRLVDLEKDRPWLSITDLISKINSRTLCLIAVNLFGIEERLAQLDKISKENNLLLIQDSAQLFPKDKPLTDFLGDFIIYSFGRGKPVSVLNGGCTIAKDITNAKKLPLFTDEPVKASISEMLTQTIKIAFFNLLFSPRIFWIPQSLPFLGIGQTSYHELDTIRLPDSYTIKLIKINISYYLELQSQARNLSKIIKTAGTDFIIDLPEKTKSSFINLNRYPILVKDIAYRNSLYNKLRESGLGASKMYQKPLNKFSELDQYFNQSGETINAQNFSQQLLTLPIHHGMNENNLNKLETIISDIKSTKSHEKKAAC